MRANYAMVALGLAGGCLHGCAASYGVSPGDSAVRISMSRASKTVTLDDACVLQGTKRAVADATCKWFGSVGFKVNTIVPSRPLQHDFRIGVPV